MGDALAQIKELPEFESFAIKMGTNPYSLYLQVLS